jgi:archaemetzincin
MKKTIDLIQTGDLDQSVLVKLRKSLKLIFKEFNIFINILEESIPLEQAEYNPIRRQYDASKILNKIINHAKNKQYFRILGVMDEDIFSSPLNFVFGIAINPSINIPEFPVVALISITRLKEKFYRRHENSALFELRILKEAIHELGHTFSLEHCNKFCIMQFSNSLADTDDKPPKFCDSCLKTLRNFFKNLNNSF